MPCLLIYRKDSNITDDSTQQELRELRDRMLRVELEAVSNAKKLDKVIEQSSETHELLLQLKGARWTIYLLAGIVGFIISKAATFAGLIGWTPK